jgi:hypothetical protein
MFNLISILIAVVLLVVTLVGLLLGVLNWIGLLIGAVGVLFGALSKNKAGLIINLVLMAIAAFRLFLGGGIL